MGSESQVLKSISLKSPNVATVYPLRSETAKTVIKAGYRPLIVFNPELNDPASLMRLNNMANFYKVLHTLSTMDVDVAILTTPKYADRVHRSLKSVQLLHPTQVFETENVFDVSLEAGEYSNVYWLSSCTQKNLLVALD